ncbi:MAG: hypothetical protein C0631_02790 [Sedimenticola sp.]|jgi:Ca2+-binding EF-hand superfamily protein|nr:MAG: hypothetical protein C0631_02790 [Sedimenticola sp.]
MNMKRFIAAAAIAMTSAYSFNALASDSELFKQLDTNADGAISADEAAADPMVSADWNTIDVNSDGMIESVEFSAFEEKAKEATQ